MSKKGRGVGMVLLRSMGTLKGGKRVMGMDSKCTEGVVLPGGLKLRTAPGGLGSLGLRGTGRRGITGRMCRTTRTFTGSLRAGRVVLALGAKRNKEAFNSISSGRVSRTTGGRLGLSVSGGGLRLPRPVHALNIARIPIELRPGMAKALGM